MEATLIENIEATTDAAASADERYQWARLMAGDWSLCAIDALTAHAYSSCLMPHTRGSVAKVGRLMHEIMMPVAVRRSGIQHGFDTVPWGI